MIVLGIESSCDETAAAIFDTTQQRLRSNVVHSQIDLHTAYGGTVPEIASRSHLEKIEPIVRQALNDAGVTLDDLDAVAVTSKPGLVGSLLVGLCFAKGLAWARGLKLVGVNHLEGHIFSSFLNPDGSINETVTFPHINLSVSGGHTSMYLVHNFGSYSHLGGTLDDAAGEAFDKVSKMMGFGYPGGPIIEKLAEKAGFQDFYKYPRTKKLRTSFDFSFSGLKTAVLYDLVKKGVCSLETGVVSEKLTDEIAQKVSSSLLVCMGDIFEAKVEKAFEQFPEIRGFSFVGGVACNKYLRKRLSDLCDKNDRWFVAPPPAYCVDNGAMIAFVGGYKVEKGEVSSFELDVL